MKNLKQPARLLILGFILALGFSARSAGEPMDVTDKQGRTITAKLVRYDGTNIDIVRISDRKAFSVTVADLDDKTQKAIREWVAKGGNLVDELEVGVNTGKTRRTTAAEDFDDKRVNLSPFVTVKNPHTKLDSKPLYLTILFLGRPVESRTEIHVFRNQTIELPKLAPLASRDFKVTPISEAYDNRGYAKFGSRYLGYLWVIHDKSKSEICACASVPSALANKNIEKFLELQEGRTYTDDLKPSQTYRYYRN